MLGVLYTGAMQPRYAADNIVAHQMDYAENPADIDVNYYLGELGATYAFVNKPIEFITIKGSYEILEGDGGVSPSLGFRFTFVSRVV